MVGTVAEAATIRMMSPQLCKYALELENKFKFHIQSK